MAPPKKHLKLRKPGKIKKNPIVTIEQVAKLAGVSKMTASYALLGYERLKPETRQKVVEVADMLGYVPHVGSKIMRYGYCELIAVVVPQITEEVNQLVTKLTAENPHGEVLLVVGQKEPWRRAAYYRVEKAYLKLPDYAFDKGKLESLKIEVVGV